MMVMGRMKPSKYSEERSSVVCPNCGSTNIKHRFVQKSSRKKTHIGFDEYAENLKADASIPPSVPSEYLWCDIYVHSTHSMINLKNCIQLVIYCDDCGYTKVYNLGDDTE